MRLKQEIIEAIKAAVDDLGTQKALADISGVSCKNINKYINGGVKTIRSEAWQKLLPHIAPYFQIAPTTAKTIHDTVLCAENIAKSVEKIEKDTDRDFYMDSKEALNYGIIDEILTQKK